MSDKNEPKKENDPELDDLLDSALQDMKKTDKKPEPTDTATAEDPQNLWTEEFIKEAAAQFESNMAAILGSVSGVPEDQITQEQIAQTFTKMAEAAAQVLKPGEQAPAGNPEALQAGNAVATADEVTAAISETLRNLSSNTENLQNPFGNQDLAGMFDSLNLGGEGQQGQENMFIPFMQGMMQSLLSKEVLYPSLKDLLDKYPAWLAENQGKVDKSEYDRFVAQKEIMEKVCVELEPEQESDPEDVKRRRFEVVLDLMQKMQDLGQPPTELIGDAALPGAGGMGMPGMGQMPGGMPGADGQCSVM